MSQPASRPAADGSACERVTDLLTITGRLIAVLEREIETLRAMKPTDLQNLQQDKIVLTAAYESALESVRAEPAALEVLPPATRDELHAVAERFQDVLAANKTALRAARDATDRVLQNVVDEIERRRGTTSGYSAKGAAASLSGYAPRKGVAVTFDQSL